MEVHDRRLGPPGGTEADHSLCRNDFPSSYGAEIIVSDLTLRPRVTLELIIKAPGSTRDVNVTPNDIGANLWMRA